MEFITLNEAIDLVIPIPGSVSGDTVTYEIFDSDGSVAQSGSMTFVRDEMWKAAWTPDTLGIFVLKANDTTITQKRENLYRVVGVQVSTPGGDWSATLTVGENTYNTGDEAEAYFASRWGASAIWDALTDTEKIAAIVTAYNQLRNCPRFSLAATDESDNGVVKKAHLEQALFLAVHGSDAIIRKGLQAQGVVTAGIVKESYDLKYINGIPFPPEVLCFLNDYEQTRTAFADDLDRNELEDVN